MTTLNPALSPEIIYASDRRAGWAGDSHEGQVLLHYQYRLLRVVHAVAGDGAEQELLHLAPGLASCQASAPPALLLLCGTTCFTTRLNLRACMLHDGCTLKKQNGAARLLHNLNIFDRA